MLRCLPALLLTASVTIAAEPTSGPRFETHIQPILQAHCSRCHATKTRKADLDLTSREGVFKGSEHGPVVVPGKLKESRLYEMVHSGKMPRGGPNLGVAEVEIIRQWIEAGAPTESAISGPEVTQHEIVPLMYLRCTVCHGLRRQEAGLDLRSKASMLKGGKSGPAIVLGKPEESLVLKKIRSGEMPPNKRLIEAGVKPMTSDEIDKLSQWIARGAPEVVQEPDVATTEPDPLVTDKDRDFWAFQPPKRVTVPTARHAERVRNPIDAFILAKLEAKGLSLSPEADRLTLIRRASFDLTGMPLAPEEVERARNDKSDDWYEKLIDRLLTSPRYGERWGRYWLDLAGYADSEGKRSQDPIRPDAYRYRDYVIRALNADKPYDRFLLEQIAGDELADYEHAPAITRELMDNLVATGFLRLAPDGTGSDVVNYVPERLEVMADEMQVFGAAVLGLTLQCARCHSHKYDPIPQRDYYRLIDVFKGAYDEHDWLKPDIVAGQSKAKAPGRVLSHVSAEERQRWEAHNRTLQQQIEAMKQTSSADAGQQIKLLESQRTPEPRIRALWDRGEPSPTYLYRRGDYLQPSKLVGPGVPSVLTDGKTPFVVTPPWPGAKQTGRRLALARWLTEPDHPLTSRVMVNRVWKHHFGTGIVKSLSNFGTAGDRPSHPELLDWLARAFVERGWSLKSLHRLLMTSSTYRQASTVTAAHEELDPDNRLLSRMSLRRLEAEALYDSLLLVAGKLDETRFGPPDPVEARKDGLVTPVPTALGWRRGIYLRQRRTQIPTILENFDLPQMNPNCVERTDSTVASQALHLRNNAMVEQLAGQFADRVCHLAGPDAARQVDTVSWIALSRPPTAAERKLGADALTRLTTHWREATPKPDEAARRALTAYCHTIVNSAAFLYVD